MPTYFMKAAARTVCSGKFDPLSLTILAVAGGVALIEYAATKK